MSEQSGGGPITREQVERAIPESTACNAHGVCKALGELWYRREDVPEDVRAGWGAIGYNDLTAALTRWRDELAAAEPVRRVARWDAERQRYMLTPPATTSHQYNPSTADRETASAWGYEIEGGPEPIQTLSRCPDCGGPRTDADEHDAWCDDLVSAVAWVEAPERAPEVVDVPQPETWHARLVRLATEAQAAGKACAEAEAVFAEADAIREKTRLIRASAREVCHAKRQALTEATTARAIVDAQQGGASRLRAAEARTAWQPIETAPVDGDYVLICAPGWLAPVMAVHDGECWWMGNDAVSGATHWQPLPATPEAP